MSGTIDPLRGTGRTTRILQDAPHGAIIVCANGSEPFLRATAVNRIGRSDLTFVSISAYSSGHAIGGSDAVVFDHAADIA